MHTNHSTLDQGGYFDELNDEPNPAHSEGVMLRIILVPVQSQLALLSSAEVSAYCIRLVSVLPI